ncbi:glutathione S-transferase family protein [Chitinimonas koreensis]|uniref:glutathione S-transferase family protein n=1 Tax=Chitinimonas koreensis TaxID=356302 RepID=UPI0003F9C0A4|nr:glutathione S-transferase family protein [Chitinimonas koreensis]QNM96923.1 glutathione S-transferase family protein [Chitinimonas koreensis]
MYRLYGSKGCGSAAIEAALVLAGQPYEAIEAAPWDGGPGVDALRALNPLAQIPTLVAPDGTVLTESVAILIWLDGQHPDAGLLPAEPAARAVALRWLVFLSANAYAAISVGDYPERWVDGEEAQASLRKQAKARLQDYWLMLEAALGDTPCLFGQRIGALDLLAATMVHWRPGRAWFQKHCPRLMAAVRHTEQDPRLAALWAAQFGR